MIEPDDCGREFHLSDDTAEGSMDVVVGMVIKAPKGTMALFHPKEDPFMYLTYKAQGDAIKLFMKEHKYD